MTSLLITLLSKLGLRSISHAANALLLLLLCASAAQAQVIGAGSTVPRELLSSWSAQYGPAFGGVNYEATGASAGLARLAAQSVDFAVTEVPMTAAAQRQAGLRQVPLAGGAVAVIVNLPELKGKVIKLNGDILADIYQGTITQWNHSQIAGSNPALALPARAIVPVFRADGSSASYVFSTYLARGNAKWRRTLGATYNLNLKAGRSMTGGQALLDAVKSTPGAIGYDSLGPAQKSGLIIAELLNGSGKSVVPDAQSIAAALDFAQWSKNSNAADLDGSAGSGAYPMTTVSYALKPVEPKTGRKSALPFVQTAVAQGDVVARQLGFLPLPATGKSLTSAAR